MSDFQPPYCLAMLLCDAVHRDATSGKHTILGTFSRINAASLPQPSQFVVYMALTDGMGKIPLELRLSHSNAMGEDAPAASAKTEIELPDPLSVLEMVTTIQTVFPKEGVWHCELFCDEDLLMSRRFLVRLKTPNAEQPPE
jgi:hypothetical protein